MTTKELEYFLSVYETHSIKNSAEKLFISSQALSKSIKKLEAENSRALRREPVPV